MKIGPLGGPILAGTEVHGPRKSVRGVVFIIFSHLKHWRTGRKKNYLCNERGAKIFLI